MTARRQRLGAAGERRVSRWYRRRGYEVLDHNWRCRDGELDLVLRKGDVVVFCEVKTRSSTRFGSPLEAVTPAKQRRIRHLGLQWIATHGLHSPELRFDVAAVLPGEVDVIESAF
jgi:putative endonuclease